MNISNELANKKILIWGKGKEGESSAKFIDRNCLDCEYEFYEGKENSELFGRFDLVLKSPGIPCDNIDPKITSQTKLFLKYFSRQVIGVTGSKGKSTTSSLLYQVIKDAGKDVFLVGNIGTPCFDVVEQIKEDSFIIFELSAHMLKDIEFAPHISLFLNFYPEHLDYYHSVEAYFEAKSKIATKQTKDDFVLVGDNVPEFDCVSEKIIIVKTRDFDLSIPGEHNQLNANFVYYVCRYLLDIDDDTILNSFKKFKGLKHRIEYIGTYDGIDFYDDSISTIPIATINGILSIPNCQTVLVGGMDRGISYCPLIRFIRSHPEINFILMYASGSRIYNYVFANANCVLVKDLYEAVDIAKTVTDKGKAILLSPAAASYDSFKNFEERGDEFKRLAEN